MPNTGAIKSVAGTLGLEKARSDHTDIRFDVRVSVRGTIASSLSLDATIRVVSDRVATPYHLADTSTPTVRGCR